MQTSVAPSPQEQQYFQQTTPVQQSYNDLLQALLTGKNLPGYFGGAGGPGLYGGINPDVTQDMVNLALKDVAGQSNLGGFLDSGVRAAISGRVAGDIRNQAEMFNLSMRQQLLGMGLQTGSQQAGQYASLLPGLRGKFETTTVKGPNPFVTAFQQSTGQLLGTAAVLAPLYFPSFGPALAASGAGAGAAFRTAVASAPLRQTFGGY